MKKQTEILHGAESKKLYNPLNEPIYRTSTFIFDHTEQGGNRFAGKEDGYIYSRLSNPTLTALENKLSLLEGSEASAVMASGMGAIASVLWTFLGQGVHLIADKALYGCTYALFTKMFTKYGIQVDLIDLTDEQTLQKSLKKNTAVVYLETPANPTMKVIDIARVSKIAHDYNKDIRVIVDNTFASPIIQQPLKHGADIVVHSITKYINGHGDLIAGSAHGRKDDIFRIKMEGIKDATGAVMSSEDAFMILRGIKTLAVRMERHSANALKIAQWLETCPFVERVYYPGLKSHPQYEVAQKQMTNGFSGVICFETNLSFEKTKKFVDSLKIMVLAVSLGDPQTLIEHPASMTHSTYSAADLQTAGITQQMIRISIGLEDADDLIADLKQAFEVAR